MLTIIQEVQMAETFEAVKEVIIDVLKIDESEIA